MGKYNNVQWQPDMCLLKAHKPQTRGPKTVLMCVSGAHMGDYEIQTKQNTLWTY